MKLIRRELLCLSGIVATVPLMSKIAWAQTQAAPKLTQILREDLEVRVKLYRKLLPVSSTSGPALPLHGTCIPGAQELLGET